MGPGAAGLAGHPPHHLCILLALCLIVLQDLARWASSISKFMVLDSCALLLSTCPMNHDAQCARFLCKRKKARICHLASRKSLVRATLDLHKYCLWYISACLPSATAILLAWFKCQVQVQTADLRAFFGTLHQCCKASTQLVLLHLWLCPELSCVNGAGDTAGEAANTD